MMSLLATIFIAAAGGLATYLFLYNGPLEKVWHGQTRRFENYFSLLFIDQNAAVVAALHMVACGVLILAAALLGSLSLLMLVPVVAALPGFYLENRQIKKRCALSEQLAPWLTILSNNLKSAPNISDAFAASTGLVQSPLREEIELLIKEVQMGEHLDRAMHRSAQRIRSPLYSSVMTTLLVGRQSGGNLPKILSESAHTLREMERLEGVVRTKTAEGKSQTFVLALLPFVVVAALHKVDPTMIPSLADSQTGQIILCISIALWMASVALARRIVKVDI